MVWYGMVWYGMVWYGMVKGMVWYGMVWYGPGDGGDRGVERYQVLGARYHICVNVRSTLSTRAAAQYLENKRAFVVFLLPIDIEYNIQRPEKPKGLTAESALQRG